MRIQFDPGPQLHTTCNMGTDVNAKNPSISQIHSTFAVAISFQLSAVLHMAPSHRPVNLISVQLTGTDSLEGLNVPINRRIAAQRGFGTKAIRST